MDGRLKLLCLLLVSLSASFASVWWQYLLLMSLLIVSMVIARLPITDLINDLRYFAVVLVFVLLVNTFIACVDPTTSLTLKPVSMPSFHRGWHFAGRLVLVILACIVMTGTTSLTTMKNTFEWYLQPIPYIPKARIATMMSLSIVFVPLTLDCYTETSNAQKSRCVELQKNPVKRAILLTLPLVYRALQQTDEIVYAMQSRCYSESRTQAEFQTGKTDWLVLVTCVMSFLACLL
jgi:energy-coupling factor transporter transmembrane protein EcfT